MKQLLIEKIAELLWEHEAGCSSPEEWKICCGKEKEIWKKSKGCSWEGPPEELAEWQRDEYRFQASAVVNFLLEKKMLNIKALE